LALMEDERGGWKNKGGDSRRGRKAKMNREGK
jgi:hypothetical protein